MNWRLPALLAAIALPAAPALAAPPYTLDDAFILAPGEGEVIPYLDTVFMPGHDEGEAGIDTNWGLADGFQLGAIVPLHSFAAGQDRVALGDISLHAKFSLTQGGNGVPALAMGPTLAIPTDEEGREKVGLDLPLHATFEGDSWEVDLGAGYRFQADADGGDLPFGGIVVQRALSGRLRLGAELYAEGGGHGGKTLVMAGPGFSWALSDRLTLVAAGHAILTNRAENGRFHLYTSLIVTP